MTVKAHGRLLSSFDPKAQVIFFYFKSVLFLFSLSLYYINLAKGVPLHLNVYVLKSSLLKDALCLVLLKLTSGFGEGKNVKRK